MRQNAAVTTSSSDDQSRGPRNSELGRTEGSGLRRRKRKAAKRAAAGQGGCRSKKEPAKRPKAHRATPEPPCIRYH